MALTLHPWHFGDKSSAPSLPASPLGLVLSSMASLCIATAQLCGGCGGCGVCVSWWVCGVSSYSYSSPVASASSSLNENIGSTKIVCPTIQALRFVFHHASGNHANTCAVVTPSALMFTTVRCAVLYRFGLCRFAVAVVTCRRAFRWLAQLVHGWGLLCLLVQQGLASRQRVGLSVPSCSLYDLRLCLSCGVLSSARAPVAVRTHKASDEWQLLPHLLDGIASTLAIVLRRDERPTRQANATLSDRSSSALRMCNQTPTRAPLNFPAGGGVGGGA